MNFFSFFLIIILQAHLLVAFPPNFNVRQPGDFVDIFHGGSPHQFMDGFDDMFHMPPHPLPPLPYLPPLPPLPLPPLPLPRFPSLPVHGPPPIIFPLFPIGRPNLSTPMDDTRTYPGSNYPFPPQHFAPEPNFHSDPDYQPYHSNSPYAIPPRQSYPAPDYGQGYAPGYLPPLRYPLSPGPNCCDTGEEYLPPLPTNKPTDKTDGSMTSSPTSTGSDNPPTTTGAGTSPDSPQTADQTPEKPQKDTCNWCLRSNCNPGACKKSANFDAKADAEKLRDALANTDTKEAVLFDILINRSEGQIELIKQVYLGFGKNSLEYDVENNKTLRTKDLLLALVKSRAEFFADELQYAFTNLKDNIVILILTPLPPCAINEISSAFYRRHKKSLMDVAKKKTSLKFEELVEETLKADRDIIRDVKADVDSLIAAGPSSWPWTRNVRVFIEIFTRRQYDHIRKVKEQYNKMFTKPDFKTSVAEFSGGGKVTAGLLAILNNIEDQPGYFADEVEGALQHLITNGIRDDSSVIRILRGRCGIDLGDIRDAYPKNHDGKNLVDVIKGKDFPDYKEAFVKLLSQQNLN